MAIEPINYFAMQPHYDIAKELASGVQLGAGFRQILDQRAAQEQALQRQQQYQADATAFAQSPNPQAAAVLALKYPDLHKPITEAWNTLSAEQQKNELRDIGTIAATLKSGRPDLALEQINQRRTALQNSGKPTAELDALRKSIEDNPTSAYADTLRIAAVLPGGDKLLSNLETLGKEQRAEDLAPSAKRTAEAKAGEAESDVALKNLGIIGQTLGSLQGKNAKPVQVENAIRSLAARGIIAKDELQNYLNDIPQDAKQVDSYLERIQMLGMSPKDQKGYTTPDANSVLSAQTLRRGQDIKHSEWVQEQEDATKPGQANEALAQRIATYKQAPLGQFAMNRPWGQATMDKVAELNPDYDAAQYPARAAAVRSFAPGGKDSANIESANTALNHLDTAKKLALALNNKDWRTFNSIANKIAGEFGAPAPTTLKAAMVMIAPEVVKAVSGAGGTGEERTHAAEALSGGGSYSPKQVLDGIAATQELFAGRLAEKKRSYERGTKLNNFEEEFLSPAARDILSGGKKEEKASKHPQDIDLLLNKYGGQ